MDFYRRGGNVAHTCRHFGISRQTLYCWQRRYDPYDLTSLEERSHRPRQCRQPTWAFSFEEKVLRLRLQFPRWGKDKLAVLLGRQKVAISVSMVGRILTRLKQQGRLVEPPRSGVPGSRRALRLRPYAVRKPRECEQFTARDVVSRWDVLQAHIRATAQTATEFLDTLQHRMPSGRCRSMVVPSLPPSSNRLASDGVRLFLLPPRSPKLNGAVERAHRTHTEECYWENIYIRLSAT